MTRILSYNILDGGTGRIDHIENMLRIVNPDIVGLVEATNQDLVKELALRLNMEYCTNTSPDCSWESSLALLSRLPILYSRVHPHSVLLWPLLEVHLEEVHGEKLTVFVAHLSAFFTRGGGGDYERRKEICQILQIMRAIVGPHLLMGDFNSLMPGDQLKASFLLRYLVEMDRCQKQSLQYGVKHSYLDFVVPPRMRVLKPLLRLIPRSQLLCQFFDMAGSLYAPRHSMKLLQDAGYVDSFRVMNPYTNGFSYPSVAPAGRIDYIFADSLLAMRLSTCQVVSGSEDVKGEAASDHLPIMAEFDRDPIRTGV